MCTTDKDEHVSLMKEVPELNFGITTSPEFHPTGSSLKPDSIRGYRALSEDNGLLLVDFRHRLQTHGMGIYQMKHCFLIEP